MKIDISLLLKEVEAIQEIDMACDYNKNDIFFTEISLASPVKITGILTNMNKSVKFVGKAVGDLNIVCDKCLEEFKKSYTVDMDVQFKEAGMLNETDDMDFYSYENDTIDLSEAFKEFLLLSLPISNYCSDQCKGLCPVCGKNLNKGECDCEKTEDFEEDLTVNRQKLQSLSKLLNKET